MFRYDVYIHSKSDKLCLFHDTITAFSIKHARKKIFKMLNIYANSYIITISRIRRKDEIN